jgi:hypothetical protein
MQRAAQIFEQIVGVLQSDRKANRPFGDAGFLEVVRRHPEMRRRGRMDDERLGVADIGEMGKELERLDEASSLFARRFEIETEYGTRAARQQALRKRMIGMFGQLRITDRIDQWMRT